MKHTQVPNNMLSDSGLTPKDILIYATIKSHMNNKTRSCFPSINTIVKESGVSKSTVIKCIKNLENNNYFKIKKKGRSNLYVFSKYDKFEPFSEEFLKRDDILPNEKAYIMATQQMMFKDLEGYGKISYNNTELSKIINLDKRSIDKYDQSLEEKGFLTKLSLLSKDESGLQKDEKIFHLNSLGQAVIWLLKKHEADIQLLQEDTIDNKKDIEMILRRMEKLEKENEEMKKIINVRKNTEDEDNILNGEITL